MRLIPGKTKVRIELFKGVSVGDIVVGALGAALVVLFAISSLPWKLGICIAIAFVTFFLVLRLDDEPNYMFVLRILRYLVMPRRFERVYNDQMLLDKQTGKLRSQVVDAFARENAEKESGQDTGGAEQEAGAEDASLQDSGGAEQEAGAEEASLQDSGGAEQEAGTGDAALQELGGAEQEGLADEPFRDSGEDAEDEPKTSAKEKRAAKKAKREAEKAAPDSTTQTEQAAAKLTKKQKKAAEKALIKEENKILKSRTATEEEKNAVWKARADRSALRKKEREEAKEDNASWQFMENIEAFTDIKDGFIEYGGEYFGTVIEIDPLEFRFFSKHRRNNSIENGVGKILRSVQEGKYANIVKIDRPILYDDYIGREFERINQLKASYESGMLTEQELQARVEILYDRIHELRKMCFEEKVVTGFYYLVLFETEKSRLNLMTSNALHSLSQGEMTARRLDTRQLAIFLKYTNRLDFEEREIDKIPPEDYAQWAMPESVRIKFRDTVVSNVITHTYRVTGYPTMVGDAFLAGVMSIPGTKVVIKCTPIDRTKAITGVDRALQELRSQYSNTNVDSKLIELGQNISSLSNLLTTLQGDNETLMDVNIYVTAYDIAATRQDVSIDAPKKSSLPVIGEMDKIVRQLWSEEGFRLTRMDFDQLNAFVASQISGFDPMKKQARGMPSNSVAATFPWIYSHISDKSGFKMGAAEGVPVFVDFFRRDDERINSNMVIIGKSGSGKSYATKSLLSNLAADDAKIFILDPENEYQELASNMHGKIINVGNAQYGRLNPFHIITALDDDEQESGGAGVTGSFATHLQFLEEFFRQILPDCEKDALEYLNSLVERMYTNRGIVPETDLSGFGPEDYPIFDDLYDEVLAEFERTENEYLRTMLRTLINYIAKFSTGGRNANIWNGPSTVTTDENFTVFNFQSMLSNRNTTIANAQMLLVLKYIDNEIIKNREYNTKYGLNRKIVVVIDEAHVFIDEKFPIALDFMFQLAKRIRKYNGMQIVITQNIKDFVGSEEIARKSTAIINACQYSFIFALAPNDIHDLCKLYEKAGGINEHEQEQIMQAPRGQAFTVLSSSSRSTFQVEVPEAMVDMFQQKEYVSHYFVGDVGKANWEHFVAGSRQAHDVSAAINKEAEEKRTRNKTVKKAVTFSILTEDEHNEQAAAVREAMAEQEPVKEETFREKETIGNVQTVREEMQNPDTAEVLLFDENLSDEEFDAMIARLAQKKAADDAMQSEAGAAGEAGAEEPSFSYAGEDAAYTESGKMEAAHGMTAQADVTKAAQEMQMQAGMTKAAQEVRTQTNMAGAVQEAQMQTGMAGTVQEAQAQAGVMRAAFSQDGASEIDALRRELMLERNRLESERLEVQRRTVEMEKAALEVQKSAGVHDAILKLGEMLQLMQQQMLLQQTALSGGTGMMLQMMPTVAAAGSAAVGGFPSVNASLSGTLQKAEAGGGAAEPGSFAAGRGHTEPEEAERAFGRTGAFADDAGYGMQTDTFADDAESGGQIGAITDDAESGGQIGAITDDAESGGQTDALADEDEGGVESRELMVDELDDELLEDEDDFDLDDLADDEDDEDDEDEIELPDEEEFEKFLSGED
ncbi:MAG: DUF87 domain-containing protein, partial [Lachnospiraceae bacterium]|nr:DUF87 domain-containing protein [Lachnospiraceae bacterium]